MSNLVVIYLILHFNVYTVLQIHKSPQARAFFKKCCTEASVTFMELLRWIRTRWASLFKMLKRMLQLRKVFSFFV